MTEYNDRVAKVANDIIDTIKDRLIAHDVSHGEYRAAWAFLMKLANSGETPLFLDVFFEAVVERNTFDRKPGSKGTLQGPYHNTDAKPLTRPYVMPMRDNEPGTPFVFNGTIVDLDGNGIGDVAMDCWHSGNDGTYSGFTGPETPLGNLRGIMSTDTQGAFEFRTIRPAPYQIPHDGPTGEFLSMLGRHSWRPAHFHFILTKPGYDTLTTQIYLSGDPWLSGDGDCVDGVKDSLIVEVDASGPTQTASYTFALRPH